MAHTSTRKWYDQRVYAWSIAVAALLLAGIVALHALDTGSLLQYLIVVLLVGLAINRAIEAVFPQRRRPQ